MKTLIVANQPAFDFRSTEYENLYRCSQATAFQSPYWLAGLHEDVAPAFNVEPITIAVRSSTGRLVMVLPLMRRRRLVMNFIEFADFGLSDYQSPVYNPGDLPLLLADSALKTQVCALLKPWDVVELAKLSGDDPVLRTLFPRAWRARMRISTYPAPIYCSWSDWRSTHMERDFRHYLDKKRRKLGRIGHTNFVLVQEETEIVRAFEHVRSFRAERFKDIGATDVTENAAIFLFYRKMAIDGARQKAARTYCLYLDDRPIAVVFGLSNGRTFWMILAAFDSKRYRGHSVGLLAIEDSLRSCLEAGDTTYDFTIGDHWYKRQFGGEQIPLYELHASRTVRGYFSVLAIEGIREAKRILKPLIKRREWAAGQTSADRGS